MQLICPHCRVINEVQPPRIVPMDSVVFVCGFCGQQFVGPPAETAPPDKARRKDDTLLASGLGVAIGAYAGGPIGALIGGLIGALIGSSSSKKP